MALENWATGCLASGPATKCTGLIHLAVTPTWCSRCGWRVSNTLDTDFCIETLEEALQRFEAPEIFNTDQGSQFTCEAFTDVLKDHAIAISMDGKGVDLELTSSTTSK